MKYIAINICLYIHIKLFKSPSHVVTLIIRIDWLVKNLFQKRATKYIWIFRLCFCHLISACYFLSLTTYFSLAPPSAPAFNSHCLNILFIYICMYVCMYVYMYIYMYIWLVILCRKCILLAYTEVFRIHLVVHCYTRGLLLL